MYPPQIRELEEKKGKKKKKKKGPDMIRVTVAGCPSSNTPVAPEKEKERRLFCQPISGNDLKRSMPNKRRSEPDLKEHGTNVCFELQYPCARVQGH